MNGPSWDEFTRAMGIDGEAAGKTAGSVYVVSAIPFSEKVRDCTGVETCFCDPPLAEERPYWEEYFELLSVKDVHSRRNCRHENGTEPWACCDCDCTKKLEEKLRTQGTPFLNMLRSQKSDF